MIGRPLDWYERLTIILADIKYKDWGFKLTRISPSSGYVQEHAVLQLIWVVDGETQKSRKWLISYHFSESEFIQTVFLAIQVAEEHETREAFKYKGVAVLGPHLDLNQKVDLDIRKTYEDKEML
jgi:hypothetical protein